jgi:phage terminase Nu1 subunit (DNA packaging protein)
MIVNRRQLAAILECQPTSIDKMVDRGMPYVSRPATRRDEWQFSTKAAIEWLAGGAYLKGDDAAPTSDLARLRVEKEREELAIRRTQRELREFEVAKLRETVISLDDMQQIFDEQHGVVKSVLSALPGRLAETLAVETDPRTCQRLIEDEVNAALAALSSDEDIPR